MLTAVLVFVLLVIALLAVPLSLSYDVSTRTGYKNDIVVTWAFGLVCFRIPRDRHARKSAGTKKAKPVEKRASRSSRGWSNGFTAFMQTALLRRMLRFISDLWRSVRKEDVQLNVRLGLGDPADTGQLWAVVGPIAGILADVEGAAIAIVPDFVDATVELDSRGSIRLTPLHILSLAAALLFSPPVWRGLRAAKRVR